MRKEKLTEKWPLISSLPEAAGSSSTESRKEGDTSAGSGVEVKVNTFGVVELSTRGIQLPAINTIGEIAFTDPGLWEEKAQLQEDGWVKR